MKKNNHSPAKIIFWGTSEFALPSLRALISDKFEVMGVVTRPDEPAGRNLEITPPPVKVLAEKHGLPVYQPEDLKIESLKSEASEADLCVVAAYGKIIPRELLEIPKYGFLNIHPSLLPRWRGPSPIQYTILNGDEKTGVTIIKMDELMDHGPILAQQEMANYQSQNTNYKILHDQLADFGAELLIRILPQYLKGEISPEPQNDSQATFSKILKKDDGRIIWQNPAKEIERMIRALNPWPGTWTLWPSATKIFRIRIEEGLAVEEETPTGSPGYVWQNKSHPLLLKTGKGSLAAKTLTIEGKRPLVAEEILRGYPKLLGTTLV